MKTKQVLIASFVLLVLHAITMVGSCGTMKKHKTETSEEQSSQIVQNDKEIQKIVDTWNEIQNEWLHELEFNNASITRDTVILSKLSAKKSGNMVIQTQSHEESKQREQAFQEQRNEEKSDIRSNKEREPPGVLLWVGLIFLIVTGLAWILKKT